MGNFAADISQLTALGTTLNGLGSEVVEYRRTDVNEKEDGD
jgi:hypothetical protein